MQLGDQLIVYCERQGPGLLAEPLNAISNLAFLVAAWRLWLGCQRSDPDGNFRLRLLAVLIASIGLASLAFHTLATRWASVLDVAFIGVFNVAWLVLFLRAIPRWRLRSALAAAAAFLAADRLCAYFMPAGMFNGSIMYVPALTALAVLTIWALRIAPATGRVMTFAAGAFLLSLTARSVDQSLCRSWPWGTHFVWHVLNAWVMFRLSRALQPVVRVG